MINTLLLALISGIVIWYILYFFDVILNSGMGNLFTMPFRYALQDIQNNLPFVGWKYRMKRNCNNEEWAKMLPGQLYVLIMHFLIPFGPAVIVLLTN